MRQFKFNDVKYPWIYPQGSALSDIHTWIYPWIYPWISISTPTLLLPSLCRNNLALT